MDSSPNDSHPSAPHRAEQSNSNPWHHIPNHLRRWQSLAHPVYIPLKALVLTGLRMGELASLSVAQLHLDAGAAFAELAAADEKNCQGSYIPIRDDLAADLRAWIAEKLADLQTTAREAGEPVPARLLPGTPEFVVPDRLHKILDRDLKAAGIPKRDDRGRSIDVHALRHTFGTLLSKTGTMPRVAKEAMRHSDIKLTMNVYTDPRLLDVRGAVERLPALPLPPGPGGTCEPVRATGTTGSPSGASGSSTPGLAPPLAPTRCKPGQFGSSPGNQGTMIGTNDDIVSVVRSAGAVNERTPLTTPVVSGVGSGRRDLNPRPLAPQASNAA
ncbi:MAG TPA: site-specific integrase [Gemmataceae bacterium]|nr:site-specific integrase [Gemmataceae bacterium]